MELADYLIDCAVEPSEMDMLNQTRDIGEYVRVVHYFLLKQFLLYFSCHFYCMILFRVRSATTLYFADFTVFLEYRIFRFIVVCSAHWKKFCIGPNTAFYIYDFLLYFTETLYLEIQSFKTPFPPNELLVFKSSFIVLHSI